MTLNIKNHKISNVLLLFYVIAPTIALDQLSKFFIFRYSTSLPYEEQFIFPVLPFLNINLVWNYGISFGMFNNAAQNQFLLITVAAFITLLLLFIYIRKKKESLKYPIGLIIGGAMGNCIDRLVYGAVLDFIDFHAWGYHYPAFNIADSAIVIGGLLLLRSKDI